MKIDNIKFENIPLRFIPVSEKTISGWFIITDYDKKEIVKINVDGQKTFKDLRTAVNGIFPNYETLNDLWTIYKNLSDERDRDDFWKYLHSIQSQESFILRDSDFEFINTGNHSKYCLKYIDFTSTEKYNHPAWDEFLSRVDPEVRNHLLAWIWSIVEPNDVTRLVCWITGKGNDGKSKFVNAITRIISRSLCFSTNVIDPNDKFQKSMMFGKILITLPDTDDDNLLENKVIKSITGQDEVGIEQKFGGTIQACIKAKILVASNKMPKIDKSAASTTRLMVVSVAPPKKITKPEHVWNRELDEQAESFLLSCKEAYQILSNDLYKITVPREINEKHIQNSLSNNALLINDYISNCLSFGEENKIHLADLYSHFSNFLTTNNIATNEHSKLQAMLKKELQQNYNCTIKQIKIKAFNKNGFRGVQLNESEVF